MTLQELQGVLEEAISQQGIHLIELEIRGEGKGKNVEVFIDAEQAVTTAMCSETSKLVEQIVDSHALIKGSYRITVSSPGIARPLKFPWQYAKHVGRDLEITRNTGEGTQSIIGKLETVTSSDIVLATGKAGEKVQIPFTEIVEARVRAPW
jgi:ribosome maturation factor RimP